MLPEIDLDDIVRLRKPHPCGSYEWKITRLGADIGLECLGCKRRVLLTRRKLARRLKTLVTDSKEAESLKFNLKFPRLLTRCIFLLYMLAISTVASCNLPGVEDDSSKMNVTEAYQTVEARLTQAVARTPTLTASVQAGDEIQTQQEEHTRTPTSEVPSTEERPTASTTPIPGDACDQAAAANPIDITIEDNTVMESGEAFTKIWRVVNVGTCTWTTEYEIVFFSGELMGAITNIPLTEVVPPDESVDISVEMVAPDTSGTYQGNWKLRGTNGSLFGIGPGGESPFWVRIKVDGDNLVTPTRTPTSTLTPTAEVQTSGSVEIALNDTLDLDSLLVNSGGADLKFRITLVDPRHQFVPLIGVSIEIYGSTQPGLADCQAGNLGSLPIFLEELSIGTYLCYRTNLGLPGWARLDRFDQDTGEVTLQIFTWKQP